MGLDLAEHDVDPPFGQLLFLLLHRHLMLKLYVHEDDQDGNGDTHVDHGDPAHGHLSCAAAQRYKDVQQKEHNFPHPQLFPIDDDQRHEKHIAQQRDKL